MRETQELAARGTEVLELKDPGSLPITRACCPTPGPTGLGLTRSEARLLVTELAASAGLTRVLYFEDEELPVEEWQIEEEIPLAEHPPMVRPALVLAGGRTVAIDRVAFDDVESAWFVGDEEVLEAPYAEAARAGKASRALTFIRALLMQAEPA